MILPIITGRDNPILTTPSPKVKKVDAKIKKLIDDMIDTAIKANGLGIAAPQVGVNLQVVIVRMNYNTDREMWLPMINPEIIEYSSEEDEKEEGCLSIPRKFGRTIRAMTVTVRYLDKKSKSQTLHLDGLNAHIMQHETDHINGILFVNHLIGELKEETDKEDRLKKYRQKKPEKN